MGGGGPEVAAHSGHSSDGGGGGGGGLQGGDLQVVSVGDLAPLGGAEGAQFGALSANGGSLGRLNGGAPDAIRGLGGGGGDVGAVADGVVAPVPLYADVVILVTKVGLGSGNGGVGGDDGIGVFSTGCAPAGDGEHAAHSEGGGAGPGGGAALGCALRGSVARAIAL